MRIREILLEYNLQNLLSLFSEKYNSVQQKDHSNEYESLEEFIKSIEEPLRRENKFQFIDPYMKWIVQRYVTDNLGLYEDITSKVIPGLLKYDSLKRKNKLKPNHKDISQIKNIHQLLDILDEYKEEKTDSRSEEEKRIEQEFYSSGEAELIYDSSQVKVVVPKTEKASCYFGRNTRWCTTATKYTNFFDTYNKKGPLYIVLIKKENKRYQFHFATDQFRDEQDKSINPNSLADKYPILWKIFTPIAEKYETIFLNKNPSEELQIKTIKRRLDDFKYIKNPSERAQLEAIKYKPYFIKYIENPSENVQLAAVRKDGLVIEFIKNPSENVQLEAVRKDGLAIKFIKNPSENIQLEAVRKDGLAIEFIKNPSENVQLAAVRNNGYALEYIKNPTKKVQLEAVRNTPNAIQFIENPSEELQLEAINRSTYSIEYIRNPTEKVQLRVIELEPSRIALIKNPSEKIQLEAVSRRGYTIEFIKNPSEKVQLVAVKISPYNIANIKKPTEKVQLEAVKKDGTVIRYIKNPSEEVQLEAVKQNRDAIKYIANPSKAVIDFLENN
ncbi:MAG: hypothetical protein NZZ41_05455 [Candidatus Dojkabacteria bacterium]|nr:hypothetical protein [Candidatus Dojkabacteria bacterium]